LKSLPQTAPQIVNEPFHFFKIEDFAIVAVIVPGRCEDRTAKASPPGKPARSAREPGHGDTYLPSQRVARVPPAVSVPGYEIESVLRRGGMGVVYKAQDLTLKRTVG
jgi:hypothetical protein